MNFSEFIWSFSMVCYFNKMNKYCKYCIIAFVEVNLWDSNKIHATPRKLSSELVIPQLSQFNINQNHANIIVFCFLFPYSTHHQEIRMPPVLCAADKKKKCYKSTLNSFAINSVCATLIKPTYFKIDHTTKINPVIMTYASSQFCSLHQCSCSDKI